MGSADVNDKRNFQSVSAGQAKREPAVLLLARLQLRKVELLGGWFGI